MQYHQQIVQVAKRIAPYIRQTPLLESEYASKTVGASVFFKAEVLQHTGSFKVRGAANKITRLTGGEVLVTASGGNHGLAVCYIGRQLGHTVKVFLPNNTPIYKRDKIKKAGAEVIMHGDVWDDANQFAMAYAKKEHAVYVHPFNDDEIIAGQATIAHELLTQCSDIEVIVGSIGGGGMLSGISQYAKSFNPDIKVYAVETLGADSMYQSIKAGQVVELPAITSMAESLAAKRVTEKTFAIIRKNVDDFFRVSDGEAIAAQLDILQNDKLLTEPAASCSLAALRQIPGLKGKKVAVILCGGNYPIARINNKEKI